MTVTIDMRRESTSSCLDINEYIFIAEIRPVSLPKLSRVETVDKKYMLDQIRTKYEKTPVTNGELFIAEVTLLASSQDNAKLMLTFNSQHCSWDYSWKSNRWSGPQEHHVIDIIVVKSMSVTEFAVISFKSSTPFVILSSHKKSVGGKLRGCKSEQCHDDHDLFIPRLLDQPKSEGLTMPSGPTSTFINRAISNQTNNMFNQINPGGSSSSGFTVPASDLCFQYQAPPIRQFKTSADGKTMKLVSFDASQQQQQPPPSTRSAHEQDVNEGALALIQLFVSQPGGGACTSTASSQTKSILSKFTGYNNDISKTPAQSSSSSSIDIAPFTAPAVEDMPAAYKYPNPSMPPALSYSLPSHMTNNLIYQRKLLSNSTASSSNPSKKSSSTLDPTQTENSRTKRGFEEEEGRSHLGKLLRISKQKTTGHLIPDAVPSLR